MPYRYLGTTAIILAAATMAPAAPSNAVQSYDSFRSWFVACDNTLHCVAKGFSEAYAGAEIDIDRDGGPHGKLLLSISADRPFAFRDIAIDGKPAGLSEPTWAIESADGSTTVSSDDLQAIRRLIVRLRGGSKLTLGGQAEVSLDGFAAAALRLDDRQGRIGGVTALANPGPLAASRVPSPPRPPRIPYRPISATLSQGEGARLIASTRAGQTSVFQHENCEADPTTMEPQAFALDQKQALVLIPCIVGAYQGSAVAFIVGRAGGEARRLILPLPYRGNDTARSDVSYFTNEDFDPKKGMLSTAAKGRALADCGMSASWIWYGKSFVLTRLTMQQTCGGIEPGDWPTIFDSIQR